MKRISILWVLGFFAVTTLAFAKGKESVTTAPEAAVKQPGEFWGGRLPETLKISLWSTKEGEAAASSISTSRQNFSAFVMIGADSKGGMTISVKGHVLPSKDGGYEVLLDVNMKGGSKEKGGMELKLKSSAMLKKGETAVLASNKDGQFFIRIQ